MKKSSDVVMLSPPRSYTVQRVDQAGRVQHIGGPSHGIGTGGKGLAFLKDTEKRSSYAPFAASNLSCLIAAEV
jgi:hypothetical protein